MNKNGRLHKILIEDIIEEDKSTGVSLVSTKCFRVWADKGMKDKIESIEGVTWVSVPRGDTKYYTFVDPRYDMEFIKKEVEAVLMCA